jgi:hypothetical protein
VPTASIIADNRSKRARASAHLTLTLTLTLTLALTLTLREEAEAGRCEVNHQGRGESLGIEFGKVGYGGSLSTTNKNYLV